MKLLTIILMLVPVINTTHEMWKGHKNGEATKYHWALFSVLTLLYLSSIAWLIRL